MKSTAKNYEEKANNFLASIKKQEQEQINDIKNSFTRANNDTNGNPRYVCHYTNFINHKDTETAKEKSKTQSPFKFFVNYEYDIAVRKANTIGGRKYHNKKYGGGIVFQSYNLEETARRILEVKNLI